MPATTWGYQKTNFGILLTNMSIKIYFRRTVRENGLPSLRLVRILMGNKKVVERIFKKLLSATNFKITCVIVFFCKANNCLNSSLIVKFLTIFLIGWGLAIIIKEILENVYSFFCIVLYYYCA